VGVLGRDVAEATGPVAEEEEADHLEDPFPGPGVDVADVAELLHRGCLDSGLLLHLAKRRELGPLAGADQALRECPGTLRLSCRPDGGHNRAATKVADDNASSRELPAHRDFVTQSLFSLAGGGRPALGCPGTLTVRVPMVVTKSSEQEECG